MSKLSYQTLRESVVDVIRMKILSQEWEPGMRIIEQELSDDLGVSRGPIREALRQLEQEGMVEYTRNVGCSVRMVTLEDIQEIYLLSSTYELLAVRQYHGKFSAADIQEMEDVLERMKHLNVEEFNQVVTCDCDLHRIIVAKAGLGRLLKAWEDLNYGNLLTCYAGKLDKAATCKRQYPIHREIVDICRAGDEDAICKAIHDHYMLTINRIMKEKDKDGLWKLG